MIVKTPHEMDHATALAVSAIRLVASLLLSCGSSDNLEVDPFFTDVGVVHLKPGSPAIDVGADLRGQGVTEDFDGTKRPQGKAVDMGAFEFK